MFKTLVCILSLLWTSITIAGEQLPAKTANPGCAVLLSELFKPSSTGRALFSEVDRFSGEKWARHLASWLEGLAWQHPEMVRALLILMAERTLQMGPESEQTEALQKTLSEMTDLMSVELGFQPPPDTVTVYRRLRTIPIGPRSAKEQYVSQQSFNLELLLKRLNELFSKRIDAFYAEVEVALMTGKEGSGFRLPSSTAADFVRSQVLIDSLRKDDFEYDRHILAIVRNLQRAHIIQTREVDGLLTVEQKGPIYTTTARHLRPEDLVDLDRLSLAEIQQDRQFGDSLIALIKGVFN